MSKRQPASVEELTLEYFVQALAAENDLDRDALNQEAQAAAKAAGLAIDDLDFGMDDKTRTELSRHVIKAVEQADDPKIDLLLADSREGAEAGALDPLTIIAAGAVVGFVILCAKLKRLDLAKRVITFDKMPESLSKVLSGLIGLA
ncbi:MAG: hypothetical protein H7Z16_10520 [Pyrinomonadaceae bacterium]|nr:hypothetical protein [Pyrinomonadaceae bacterium]